METLLKNRIRECLERLARENVGYIDAEDGKGIQYCIDGRAFYISVEEMFIKEK